MTAFWNVLFLNLILPDFSKFWHLFLNQPINTNWLNDFEHVLYNIHSACNNFCVFDFAFFNDIETISVTFKNWYYNTRSVTKGCIRIEMLVGELIKTHSTTSTHDQNWVSFYVAYCQNNRFLIYIYIWIVSINIIFLYHL